MPSSFRHVANSKLAERWLTQRRTGERLTDSSWVTMHACRRRRRRRRCCLAFEATGPSEEPSISVWTPNCSVVSRDIAAPVVPRNLARPPPRPHFFPYLVSARGTRERQLKKTDPALRPSLEFPLCSSCRSSLVIYVRRGVTTTPTVPYPVSIRLVKAVLRTRVSLIDPFDPSEGVAKCYQVAITPLPPHYLCRERFCAPRSLPREN